MASAAICQYQQGLAQIVADKHFCLTTIGNEHLVGNTLLEIAGLKIVHFVTELEIRIIRDPIVIPGQCLSTQLSSLFKNMMLITRNPLRLCIL